MEEDIVNQCPLCGFEKDTDDCTCCWSGACMDYIYGATPRREEE